MKRHRIMLLSAVVGLLLLGSQSTQASLIGYWSFDGSGTDLSPSGKDLVISTGTGFASGLFGQALNLDGNPSHFASRAPHDDAIYDFGLSNFTVQGWINYNTTTNEQVLIEKWVGISGPGWTLPKLANDAQRFHATTAFFIDSAPLTIDTGVWHHIVARRSGVLFNIFFDGTEVASGSFAGAVEDTTMPLLIGKRNDDDPRGGFAVNGLIDEVAIWNQALSNTDIAFLWNNGTGRQANAFPTAVPEPSTFLLLSTGAFSLLGYGWRQRQRALRAGNA